MGNGKWIEKDIKDEIAKWLTQAKTRINRTHTSNSCKNTDSIEKSSDSDESEN